ncbi:FAD-binding oxidoreductase [Roseisalinus antarcticus]|uniref:Benzoate 1,2-dioxygenase electron transfer component n=1 Tax=Roseisalinus antarcticus TaxID=254357 RepID=A0A1Y5U2Z9_9RHOB|nr:FAD-binding oxidoreductase [Roseisalinus antarcticus]SLN75621.1 Benzoate 1,2-dioxygenase electron transfer component [Roseisalinus antarcticus]
MTYTLTLAEIGLVTHDTHFLHFEPVEGLTWTPGQATELAFDLPGIRDEKRPFTFTSQPGEGMIEFVIKSYPDHEGVTARIKDLRPGDRAFADEPWGAISDQGQGTFIAGGAGMTPFIPILRKHARDGGMNDRLVFANKAERDIILREEWDAMDGLQTVYVTDAEDDGHLNGPLDGAVLDKAVSDFDGTFYVCGPPPMIEAVTKALSERGVTDERIVQEE